MTRTAYIKKNSHTQRHAVNLCAVRENIVMLAGISYDEWLMLLFEFGCLYIERRCGDDLNTAKDILTNAENGFWADWICYWLEDDAFLLAVSDMTPHLYIELKRNLLKYE